MCRAHLRVTADFRCARPQVAFVRKRPESVFFCFKFESNRVSPPFLPDTFHLWVLATFVCEPPGGGLKNRVFLARSPRSRCQKHSLERSCSDDRLLRAHNDHICTNRGPGTDGFAVGWHFSPDRLLSCKSVLAVTYSSQQLMADVSACPSQLNEEHTPFQALNSLRIWQAGGGGLRSAFSQFFVIFCNFPQFSSIYRKFYRKFPQLFLVCPSYVPFDAPCCHCF